MCGVSVEEIQVNPLWPSDGTWRHRSGSTSVHVMACCLMAPSHYLNFLKQCLLIVKCVLWHCVSC